jgi:hypothetical protein
VANAVDEIDTARELKVLERVIPFWKSAATEQNGYGWQTDPDWQSTTDTAATLGLVTTPPEVSEIYTNDYLK